MHGKLGNLQGAPSASFALLALAPDACIFKQAEHKNVVARRISQSGHATKHDQAPTTKGNRQRFMDFCAERQLRIMSTCFQKPDSKLLTYRDIGASHGPPWTRLLFDVSKQYEILDVCLAPQRWKNTFS